MKVTSKEKQGQGKRQHLKYDLRTRKQLEDLKAMRGASKIR